MRTADPQRLEPGAPSAGRRNRRLAVSAGLVFAAFLARVVLVRAGGPIGTAARWLPLAVTASTMMWVALSVARDVPGVWGISPPVLPLGRRSPARVVAINGMLAGVAVVLSLAGSRTPGLGWAVYWLGALPIMLAVSLDPRWGFVAYGAAALVIAEALTPRAGLVFALFSGLLGAVSGAAAASRRSWLVTWILCAAALGPGLIVLLFLVPGFPVFGLRPNPHTPNGVVYILLAAVVWGLCWTMTAMLLYRPIVRAVRQRLAIA